MKNTIGYIVLVLVVFGMLYYLNGHTTRHFVWKETYSKNDKQPLGTYAFDKMLTASLEKGYSHSYKSIRRLIAEEDLTGRNLLITTVSFDSNEDERNELLSYINEGGVAMIAASGFDFSLRDTLGFSTESAFSSYITNKLNIRDERIETYFCSPSVQKKKYKIPSVFVSSYFELDAKNEMSTKAIVVAKNEKDQPIMIRYPIGKGNLILSSTPEIFTNYGILDTENNEFIWTSIAYITDKPLLRSESYHAKTDKSLSPLRYILSVPTLRWALYVTLVSILLLMMFTAKRKQKPIPVIKPPENKMLSFVRSIAGLYLQKNNNADIVRKKYIYWADKLKKRYGLDIINETHSPEFLYRVSDKTGQSPDKIIKLFRELDTITADSHVSDTLMMDLIERMDLIN